MADYTHSYGRVSRLCRALVYWIHQADTRPLGKETGSIPASRRPTSGRNELASPMTGMGQSREYLMTRP